jgi:hypothetical protein
LLQLVPAGVELAVWISAKGRAPAFLNSDHPFGAYTLTARAEIQSCGYFHGAEFSPRGISRRNLKARLFRSALRIALVNPMKHWLNRSSHFRDVGLAV